MAITLTPIEPAELGRFLDLWRQSEPLWIPSQIELTHASSRRQRTNNAYSTRILFAATYVDPSRARNTP